KAGKLPKWAVYRLRERESHPRAGGRVPAPAATAAARGLLFGRKQHTRDRVLEKERVRRRAALEHAHFDSRHRDRAGIQSVHEALVYAGWQNRQHGAHRMRPKPLALFILAATSLVAPMLEKMITGAVDPLSGFGLAETAFSLVVL